jgi:hypothetical protein
MTDLCAHCGLAIAPRDLVIDTVAGVPCRFCCQGCRGAYRIITGAGLGGFYTRRDWSMPGTPEGAFTSAFDDAFLSRFVSRTEAGAEISFLSKASAALPASGSSKRSSADSTASPRPGSITARTGSASASIRSASLLPSFSPPSVVSATCRAPIPPPKRSSRPRRSGAACCCVSAPPFFSPCS